MDSCRHAGIETDTGACFIIPTHRPSTQFAMVFALYPLIRPLLFQLEAERAHDLTLRLLDWLQARGLLEKMQPPPVPNPVRVMGLEFPGVVGLAAGLDKNAAHIDALGALGFSFLEVGTVTPRPQPGNPQPRMFRIPAREALINRMGFNNEGVDNLLRNLDAAAYRGILGINIGKNKTTPDAEALADYLNCMRKVYPAASYITINVSSPNTPGLRNLQARDVLRDLIGRLKVEQIGLEGVFGRYVPLVLKIAPDLDAQEVRDIAQVALEVGIDGLIATNTTVARNGVAGQPHAMETGGMSGAPLCDRSTQVIRTLCAELGGRVPVIASGGVTDASSALEKIEAGASLVQVYTGLIYRGPRLIREISEAVSGSSTLPS